MAKTTLIITTRDRPNYLRLVLESVFRQTRPFDTVIVSDNSSSKSFKEQNKVVLVPFLEKYREILSLIPTPQDFASDVHTKFIQENYVGHTESCVLFHDDDELLPHYHETIIKPFKIQKNIVAVGCNALKLKNKIPVRGTVMRQNKGTKTIKGSQELLKPYMEVGPLSTPPLCSYIFKSGVFKSISFDSKHGGKYSDLVALSEAATFGPIVWIYQPLMRYRIHSMQNSQEVSTLDFRNLLNYMIKKGKFDTDSIYIQSYRFKHMRLKLKFLFATRKWRSVQIISKFIICFILKRLIWRKQTYGYIWRNINCK